VDEFDWRGREREFNRLPHYRAQVDGQWVHFVHARGNGPAPLPIVLSAFYLEPPPGSRVQVPSGFAVFADSHRPGSARPPRELAEAGFNITRWTRMPRGGHFAALE
jgi:hypothetical protein